MAPWLNTALALLALGLAALLLAAGIGAAAWRRSTARLVERLWAPAGSRPPGRVDFRELEGLPEPVARYFRLVLKDGQPLVRRARLSQEGGFRLRPGGRAWAAMQARQCFAARGRGFVWDADIRLLPLLTVRVRDAYVQGRGLMQARLMSWLPLVAERGKPELDAGALQRYLAEAVWFPTALLPGQGVRWRGMDGHRAEATLEDSGTRVSLEFRFNQAGEIAEVYTPGRYRAVEGSYRLTPWSGRYGSYGERNGMRIPLEAEVSWDLPGGRFTYWKARITQLEHEF